MDGAPFDQLVCADRRCATLLPADAELCDECGGTDLRPLHDAEAVLVGLDRARATAYRLAGSSVIVGRSAPDSQPDVDVSRLEGAESVHRRHASVERTAEGWQATHLGRNPLVRQRGAEATPVAPGDSIELRSGDGLVVGLVRLRFYSSG